MANAGRGYGRPTDSDDGLLQVLMAYVSRGGRLFAARLSQENPLTLTHLLWEGPGGVTLNAVRQSDESASIGAAEQEAWVQLALAFPTAPSSPSGPQSPWQLLMPDRDKVISWITSIRQSYQASHSYPAQQSAYGQASPPSRPISFDPSITSQAPWRSNSAVSGGPTFGGNFNEFPPSGGEQVRPGTRQVPPVIQTSAPPVPPAGHGGEQWSGAWSRSSLDPGEVVALPSIEVELPSTQNNVGADEFRRDFSRDVALHFNRAARSLSQVREVRGWMRGDRMILAARIAVAMGSRAPTRAEAEAAARLLADALAQRSLPYTLLTFADPGEWVQGAVLPPG